MNNNLKSFVIGAVFIVFVVVGIGGAIYGAWRMGQPGPVAPTVPQIKPHAEGLPTPACALSFNVPEIPPPPPPPPPPPSPPAPSCNSNCQTSSDCPSDLICSNGRCRNDACTTKTDCKCPAPLKVCNETCTVNADCQSQYICAGGNCRNPSCITQPGCSCPPSVPPAPYVPPVPVPPAPVITYTHKICRNYACVTVNGRAADTCSSDASCQPVAKPPVIPPSGVEFPTIIAILGGVGMLVVGLLVL